jgi:hypothetical protein
MAKLCILGGGFIGRFYVELLIKFINYSTIVSPLK